MGYLRGDDLREPVEDRTLAPPTTPHAMLPLSPSFTREVTPSSVLAVADAYACVRVLADTISTLPLRVLRRTATGRLPVGDDARAVQLLARPSPGSTSVDLVSQLVTHLCVYGNGYLGKYRERGLDRPVGHAVSRPRAGRAPRPAGRLCPRRPHRARARGHLHVKAMSMDGLTGLNPVAQCRTALGLNENLRESSSNFFRNGSRPSGILTMPGNGTHEQVQSPQGQLADQPRRRREASTRSLC